MSLIHDTSTAIQALRQLDSVGLAAMICDATGIVQLVNSAADALFDEEPSQLEGQNIFEVDGLAPLRKMLVAEQPQINPEMALLYNRLHCLIRMQRIGRVGYIFTFEDVSELKLSADRLATALNTVAHDLKAPISAVKGFADLVRNTGELNDKQEMFLGRIFTAANNMEGLLRDLVDITWLDTDKPLTLEPVRLASVLQSALDILANHRTKRQTDIATTIANDLPEIQGDGRRLERVFVNLIGNAIKYTPVGGSVTITLSANDSWQIIEVADNGIGISAEYLPHIFKRFYRVPRDNDGDDKIDGTGLGLSIVKTIVDRHQGDVTAISEPEKGSVFVVRLPTSTAETPDD